MTWFILASCSAFLSAGAAILQKGILRRLSAIEFSFLVSLCILACSLFAPFAVDVTAISFHVLMLLVAKSLLGGFAFLLVMMSLEHNDISTAMPLLGLTPAVTALISLLVLGESLQSKEWIGIGLLMVGIYLVERKAGQGLIQPLGRMVLSGSQGYIFGALGLFGVSSVMDKMLLSSFSVDPVTVLFYQHIVYCAMFGALLLVRRASLRSVVAKGWGEFLVVVIIAILTISYRFTQLEATKLAPVALVLAVKRTSILYASFVGGKIFSEERLPTKLIGGTLIVAAGFLILRTVA